ncbi:restriction endonuclease subunit S, partial [Oribacterium sp. oral taxon 078]|uniref:restriction endonuclease subunit S n=1 Tax=Oribacterium sp. oral taxon 078 TaxID=652706 RepID=UPI000568F73E
MEIWNEGKIKDFVDVKGGKRLPKGKKLAGFPTAHPYIRIRDIDKSKVLQLTADYEYVDDETQKEISRYIVSKGDILISVVGTIGLVGIVGDTLDGANQTENCDKLTNFRNIDRDFLYYYLVSHLGQGEIAKGTVGAVQPKLPLKNIQDFTVRFPSLQTQEKIASVLTALDDKIEKNTEVNENLAA